jgi:hypothetical protein
MSADKRRTTVYIMALFIIFPLGLKFSDEGTRQTGASPGREDSVRAAGSHKHAVIVR